MEESDTVLLEVTGADGRLYSLARHRSVGRHGPEEDVSLVLSAASAGPPRHRGRIGALVGAAVAIPLGVILVRIVADVFGGSSSEASSLFAYMAFALYGPQALCCFGVPGLLGGYALGRRSMSAAPEIVATFGSAVVMDDMNMGRLLSVDPDVTENIVNVVCERGRWPWRLATAQETLAASGALSDLLVARDSFGPQDDEGRN